jgi:hypothetical protein
MKMWLDEELEDELVPSSHFHSEPAEIDPEC